MKNTKSNVKRKGGYVITNTKVFGKQAYANKCEYQQEYEKTNYRRITFKFNVANDLEVIERLEAQDNATDYVRKLILKDIKENKEG